MTPALDAAYAEPHRRYHTRAHIDSCLAKLAQVSDLAASDRQVMEYAIWWHDAVYDPTRTDNEAASARLARRDLADLAAPPEVIDDVERLILLTAGHSVAPDDRLGAIMVSIDLSILGEPPATYAAYAAAIREEYAHVPELAFCAGRRRVLESFLAAPAIFPDPAFRALYEAQARGNIAWELARLG